jgi:hypothetical protein
MKPKAQINANTTRNRQRPQSGKQRRYKSVVSGPGEAGRPAYIYAEVDDEIYAALKLAVMNPGMSSLQIENAIGEFAKEACRQKIASVKGSDELSVHLDKHPSLPVVVEWENVGADDYVSSAINCALRASLDDMASIARDDNPNQADKLRAKSFLARLNGPEKPPMLAAPAVDRFKMFFIAELPDVVACTLFSMMAAGFDEQRVAGALLSQAMKLPGIEEEMRAIVNVITGAKPASGRRSKMPPYELPGKGKKEFHMPVLGEFVNDVLRLEFERMSAGLPDHIAGGVLIWKALKQPHIVPYLNERYSGQSPAAMDERRVA